MATPAKPEPDKLGAVYGAYRANPRDEAIPAYRWTIEYTDAEHAGVSPGEPLYVDGAHTDPGTYKTKAAAVEAAQKFAAARAAEDKRRAAEAAKAAEAEAKTGAKAGAKG